MKPQDILFIILLLVLIWKSNPKYFVIVALFCLLAAIPLYQFWVFFTAERLVWYAGAFLLGAIIFSSLTRDKKN